MDASVRVIIAYRGNGSRQWIAKAPRRICAENGPILRLSRPKAKPRSIGPAWPRPARCQESRTKKPTGARLVWEGGGVRDRRRQHPSFGKYRGFAPLGWPDISRL